jgi:hypothetical protein
MKAKAIFLSGVMVSVMTVSALATQPAEPAAAPVANNIISGVVVDQLTGEALTGVEVQVEGTELKTYTDFEGQFAFDQLKAGEYKVKANLISYENAETKAIKVNSNELHALNLQLKAAR